MSIGEVLLAHSIARQQGKPPFFFSRFNFDRMKERGNTHFCFDCGGPSGFKPGKDGEATNVEERYLLGKHDPKKHADAVIGNADKFENVWDWLGSQVTKDFPYLVAIR